MEQVLKIVDPIVQSVTKDFEHCTPVVFIAEKTGLKPGHIIGAGFLAGLLLVITGIASGFITALMGFLYPAYMSFKSLESAEETDDMQWLTYWVVFVTTQFLDNVFGIFFSLIPLYHLAKLVFYVYLYYPKSRGAVKVYEIAIRPLLKKYESKIDEALKKGQDFADKAADSLHEKKE
eukprot:CAMPEP_0114600086 /NCGR_PEP_ID=MMETSP0125-20121206/22627_1 /TAXON_ID=485358 ORGANISM="Aristerostoma sp., Strain ATCC 50986" /NCGR_SAMPLE_ID=MMETSP0125 /ASSEMBLY_ACC=CAM_ASM_000245 /LENGTH=176 /DNA_ID=CAMNT_0001807807 /DNA_START=17 /DNA_END=547 /DNA_ORIENTATION=+